MLKAARCFENLRQGEFAMPWSTPNAIMRLAAPFRPITNVNRIFEVLGCTTREASRQQFKEGLGYWRHVEKHPNNTRYKDGYPHWEHSVGVSLWAKKHPERLKLPGVDIKTGHANSWTLPGLRETTPKQQLLEEHENIRSYAKKLGIEGLLDQ
jgi:hypothetical protein